jgi:hypothetical protein
MYFFPSRLEKILKNEEAEKILTEEIRKIDMETFDPSAGFDEKFAGETMSIPLGLEIPTKKYMELLDDFRIALYGDKEKQKKEKEDADN